MRQLPPLLGVPGTLCDGRLFDDLARHLGEGPPPRGAAAATEGRAAPPARFVILGFSLGGFVALEALRRVPAGLAGVVLISSNARSDPFVNAVVRRDQVARLARGEAGRLIEAMWPDYVAPASADRADLRARLITMAENTSVETFAAQAELAISRPDSRASLPSAKVPVLVMGGHYDRLCPPDRQQEIAELTPPSTLVMLDTGHFAPLEDPTGVADAIARWSAELATA